MPFSKFKNFSIFREYKICSVWTAILVFFIIGGHLARISITSTDFSVVLDTPIYILFVITP